MQVTRMETPSIPTEVTACLRGLADAGGRAWLVGGAVRDLLQGRVPRDYDLVTDLTPDAVAAAVPGACLDEARFGAARVAVGSRTLTVTTLRAESGYADRRRPDQVRFVRELEVDARRRDFTVNALYLDPLRAELSDPCGGKQDLERGLLRCVGEPRARFEEDALRLLRLARFAGSAGLRVEDETVAAAQAAADGLRALSAERVYAELTDLITGPGRGRALRWLVDLGAAAVLLPEVAAMDGVPQPPEYHPEGDVLTHVVAVLDHVPDGDAVLSWSAVLHDVGKPPTFEVAEDRIRFHGHDVLSSQMAEDVLARLRAPKALRLAVVDVCRQHIRFAALPQMRPARAERWLREPGFEQHLAFHRADCLGSHGKLEIYEFARRRLAELPPVEESLLQGRDVLSLGVPMGPEVGALLRAVAREIDEREAPTSRAEALVLLRDAVRRGGQGAPDADR